MGSWPSTLATSMNPIVRSQFYRVQQGLRRSACKGGQAGEDVHSQFAFSGARILRMSMLRRPWEVLRIISGSTPISFPILYGISYQREAPDCAHGARATSRGERANSVRVPVLDNGGCRVNDCAIHVPQETRKGSLLGRLAVIWLRAHDDGSECGEMLSLCRFDAAGMDPVTAMETL